MPQPDRFADSRPPAGRSPERPRSDLVRRLLEIARDEDLGPDGLDPTSELTDASEVRAAIAFREPGVVAGLAFIPDILEVYALTGSVSVEVVLPDGGVVAETAITTQGRLPVAWLTGPRRAVTVVERPILNLVGRLSGIATRAAAFVRETEGTRAGVYDTRKTTPGLRVFEKYAVLCGGGRNHRMGLFDAVLIKDNHLAGVGLGGLTAWVEAASDRARTRGDLAFVQIEVDSLDQFDRVMAAKPGAVDLVLLDNFTTDELVEAVRRRDLAAAAAGSVIGLEASGGVSLETIGAIARTGVDRISVGSITHGARSLDVGLDLPPPGA